METKQCSCGRPEHCKGYGICHAEGCTNECSINRYSYAKAGYVKGEPRLFCRAGHCWPRPKAPRKLCQCGCKQECWGTYARGHNPRAKRVRPESRWQEEDRGFKLGGRPSPCWVWKRSLQSEGYAQDRATNKLIHRVHYESYIGPIPEGHHLHHRCEVACGEASRRCVNPYHLEPHTPRQHTRLHRSRLTEHDVRVIVRSVNMTHAEAAERFGMTAASIWNVRKGIRWTEVVHDEWARNGWTGFPKYKHGNFKHGRSRKRPR